MLLHDKIKQDVITPEQAARFPSPVGDYVSSLIMNVKIVEKIDSNRFPSPVGDYVSSL